GGAALLVLVVLGASSLIPPQIKPPPYGTELYETESAYNYIQVIRDGSQIQLVLNEGQAVHSIYDPTRLATGGYWDDMLLAPDFRPAAGAEIVPHRILILGLAGGTIARQYEAAFGGGVHMTGVELDPEIVKVARRYFALQEPDLRVVVGDARYFLATRPASVKYDAILVDVYQQPYIPFYMTTRQFFQLVREHLAPGGTAAINVGRTATDYRLVAAIASTMRPDFDSVYLLNPEHYLNTVVYGTTEPTSLHDVRQNLRLDRGPLLGAVAEDALATGDIRASTYHGRPFTDDWAPVENLIDSIIFSVGTRREPYG
ncbi:MAG TPA: fused MFS/spermidine synthase, partial [Candidatus Dormibacteraeota bacterium]|nr:fused MFS/spermidine synthase [Candidatus Dormibacteraeota bacterium]